MLTKGEIAPSFKLPDQSGNLHTLEQYRGQWVVLYFYPKDNTPGCTIEACSFRDNWEAVKPLAVVFGVSTDSTASHTRFVEKFQLPFPLLADINRGMVTAYKVWAPKKFMGREFLGTHRTTYIIDPEGKIAKVYPDVKPAGHAVAIIADLILLQSTS